VAELLGEHGAAGHARGRVQRIVGDPGLVSGNLGRRHIRGAKFLAQGP
jgi:hypothetical protein